MAWTLETSRLHAPRRLPGRWVVRVEGNRIEAVTPGPASGGADVDLDALAARADVPGGLRLLPGFIDLHIHGFGGHDPSRGDADDVGAMAVALARFGTTSFLPTLAAMHPDPLLEQLRRLRLARERQAGGGGPAPEAEMLGVHLEGPYLNPEYKGAQDATAMRPASPEEFERLWEASGAAVRLMALAPEVPQNRALIPLLRGRGVTVSLGHTAATYEQALEAVALGATQVCHCYNAMSGLHHRRPGVVGAAMTEPRLAAELIADGVHVHPAAMTALARNKLPGGLILVSDAVAPAGLPDGEYRFGPKTVFLREGTIRLADGTLAGSTLTLDRALQVLTGDGGLPFERLLQAATLNPARQAGVAGRKGQLVAGADADMVLLDGEGRVSAVWVRGRLAHAAPELAEPLGGIARRGR